MENESTVDATTRMRHRFLFEELGFVNEEIVALNMGAPGEAALVDSQEMLAKATEKKLAAPSSRYLFQYGPRVGGDDYREELAKFLSHNYQDSLDREDLVLTAGATHGLSLVTTLFFQPGDTIFVEDPTYFIAINMLREDYGMNIISVPTDEKGTNVEEFEKILKTEKEKHRHTRELGPKRLFWSMLYLIPTYNNPTGRVMAPDRCMSLIKLARKHDLLLMCDDVYNLLTYDPAEPPPQRLLAYDKKTDPDFQGHVISNGTFSKIFAPGVRVGWIEASPRIVNLLKESHTLQSGGGVNHCMAGILAGAMETGMMSHHLEMLKMKYAKNMKQVCKTLKDKLPKGVEFSEPKGGYFIWLTLPESVNCEELVELCKRKYRLDFMPGS
ncbi:uncharacterized protein YER152C, partial [Lingula anatina]|uniref:Uncharacterized protein YER152C n=1 Tax=Lingula anatina TaxID=7574 RepID=A0A1S3J3X3_LINAN